MIRFGFKYLCKTDGGHLLEVTFYEPNAPALRACHLEVCHSSVITIPIPGEKTLPRLSSNAEEQGQLFHQVSEFGRIYVAGIKKEETFTWVSKEN